MSGFLIVPGLGNSGEGHWQSHWERRFPDARRVYQAAWDRPDLQRWSDQIVRTLEAHGDAWIIAHSFGCLATVHALAKISDLVRGVFLVAPADPDKFGVAKLLPRHALTVKGAMVVSRSDPWLSFDKAKLWALRWELPVFDAGNAGHINVDSGHDAWEQGWSWLQQLRRLSTDEERNHERNSKNNRRNSLQLVDIGAIAGVAPTWRLQARNLSF